MIKFKNYIIYQLLFIEYRYFNNKKFLLSVDRIYHIIIINKVGMLGPKIESNAPTNNALFTKKEMIIRKFDFSV